MVHCAAVKKVAFGCGRDGSGPERPARAVTRYDPPRPGTKTFIVTRQQKHGWEGPVKETSEIVSEAPAEAALSLKPMPIRLLAKP